MQLDLSIFNPKSRSLIGLDISSSSVKMVELASDGKNGYRVERYTIEVLPRDAVADGNIVNLEAAAEAVRRAWKKLATSTKHVAIALPASHVITKKIIVAAGQREEELEVQVESEANQYIPFALDEVNLDFQVIGPAPAVIACFRGIYRFAVLIKTADLPAVHDFLKEQQLHLRADVAIDIDPITMF